MTVRSCMLGKRGVVPGQTAFRHSVNVLTWTQGMLPGCYNIPGLSLG
jgi:hypothetical protein